MKTRLVVQGANIPFTPGAEKMLDDRGGLVVPDFIARVPTAVLEAMKATNVTPRRAALDLAIARVTEAMSYRRFSI